MGPSGNPASLLLQDPEFQAAIRAGRRFRFGDTYKGAVLDLTGLGGMGLPSGAIHEVINGLIKAVRTGGTAQVIIDPWEPWTADQAVLGQARDETYERKGRTKTLPDGKLMITLARVEKKPPNKWPRVTYPPARIDAVLGTKCQNRATGTYELRVIEDGVIVEREVQVNVPSKLAGTVAAVAAWVASRTGRTVALSAKGHLAAVVSMLIEGECRSPNIDFSDGVRKLLAAKRWQHEGEWATGHALGHGRAVAASRSS